MPEDTIPTDKVDIDLTSFKITFLTNNHFWEKKEKKIRAKACTKGMKFVLFAPKRQITLTLCKNCVKTVIFSKCEKTYFNF